MNDTLKLQSHTSDSFEIRPEKVWQNETFKMIHSFILQEIANSWAGPLGFQQDANCHIWASQFRGIGNNHTASESVFIMQIIEIVDVKDS